MQKHALRACNYLFILGVHRLLDIFLGYWWRGRFLMCFFNYSKKKRFTEKKHKQKSQVWDFLKIDLFYKKNKKFREEKIFGRFGDFHTLLRVCSSYSPPHCSDVAAWYIFLSIRRRRLYIGWWANARLVVTTGEKIEILWIFLCERFSGGTKSRDFA